ncbi:hypothetical protein JIN85_13520 [Luteolibacter pohnpeiensis]|uniref:Uncharacterized protein n=1 Tax=Luteolibacter pohnpeiensis TaxID=454153 RepID=A0A934S8S6_9BACT|nr:hypothetical protein [Luteolibacter pohnpeiensis]MBK1883440.1 hypothetical protein [Luteolibacter pohnpeiensis]
MTHPDPEFQKVGELSRYWIKLLLSKLALFTAIIAMLILLGILQKNDHIGTFGTYAILLLAIAGIVAFFTWDLSPSLNCPRCHSKMLKRKVHPTNSLSASEEVMILCCPSCKIYFDLKVSIE